MNILTKSALPSSTGCSTTFPGTRAEKRLKETPLTRSKLGVVVKKPNLLVADYTSSSSSDNESTLS